MKMTTARLITLIGRKSQRYIGSALSKYNISAAEQPFFVAVQQNEGATQEELTAMAGVDKAATARAVKSLEEKGFIRRVQDEKDRRQNRLYPTDKAKSLRNSVRGELLGLDSKLTEGIDDDSLKLVYETLCRMNENLDNLLGDNNGKHTK